MQNIVVVGLGYVGLSSAVLLATSYKVLGVDINNKRISLLQQGLAPFKDELLGTYLQSSTLHFKTAINDGTQYQKADLVVLALPTDYDEENKAFITVGLEREIGIIYRSNPDALVVIKSTVPIGFTERISRAHPGINLLVSPEFLREGRALEDSLHPSRIVIGTNMQDPNLVAKAQCYLEILQACLGNDLCKSIIVSYSEAEAIKLFSNAYLAMRVAFFNELDTYSEAKGIDSKHVIEGVCLDYRIGCFYNNPSFGYGGYCLPKDTKELLGAFGSLPQALLQGVVMANEMRAQFIADNILKWLSKEHRKIVGVYFLAAKSGSDNSRQAAIFNILKLLKKQGIKIIVYDPSLSSLEDLELTHDLQSFKQQSTLILANRYAAELDDVKKKVYTRDIFARD